MIDWEIKGREFGNCNCDYSCPCQFNALPTHGDCEASVAYEIDEGHFGDVKLDGLRMAGIYHWDGPVHKGGGEVQLIVDERADEQQRDAMLKIMMGEETEEMATMWAVYAAMCTTFHEPLVKPIDLEIDIENRTGRVSIPGVVETTGEPIRNPVTGKIHRARIDIPYGFEFEIAEIGSASTKAVGAIKLDLQDSYGQWAELHLSNSGIVRSAA